MKKVQWWLATYVPNLLQREPLPIGVILLSQEKAASRFLEDKDASSIVASLSNYTAWISYWQHRLEEPTPETLRDLLVAEPDSNYLVAPAGERLVELETDEQPLLDGLFASLVSQPLQAMKSESTLVGRLVGLSVSDESEEQRIATLRFEEKGQRKQAQLYLDEEQYKVACDALRDGLWVEARGFSEPTQPRSMRCLKSFQILQPQSPSFVASLLVLG